MARDLVFQGVDVLGQNELKLTYYSLYLKKFSGGFAPGHPHRGRWIGGKTGERKGKGEKEMKGEDMGGKGSWTGGGCVMTLGGWTPLDSIVHEMRRQQLHS
jgi:hypothetical protein